MPTWPLCSRLGKSSIGIFVFSLFRLWEDVGGSSKEGSEREEGERRLSGGFLKKIVLSEIF